MTDFYGGTLADYIRYCDDRYSGKLFSMVLVDG